MQNHTFPIVRLENVSKSLENRLVLAGINLYVQAAEFLCILGPSGCGKTTLLNLISGLEIPDSGNILIDNRNVNNIIPQNRPVNTIFQNYALFPHLTVFDNVAFGLHCKGMPSSDITSSVVEILRKVQLEKFMFRKPAQLSGGQKQRVAIARAVVNKPKVLLLDEPLSSLDYRLRKTIQLELKQLQKQLNIAFVFVTHDQEEALSISDRIAVMEEGTIVQVGTPQEVYEKPNSLKVARFIGEANIFEVTVVDINSEEITVLIEDSCQLKVKNSSQFQKGQPLCLLVRPEDLRVFESSNTQESNVAIFSGMIEQVIYKGPTVDLMTRLKSGRLLRVTQFFNENHLQVNFKTGESIWVGWSSGWEVVLIDES